MESIVLAPLAGVQETQGREPSYGHGGRRASRGYELEAVAQELAVTAGIYAERPPALYLDIEM